MLYVDVGVRIALYCTPGVGACVVCRCGCVYCMVLYVVCGCMCCDVHCVYVYMIEENQMKRVLVGCGN